MHVLQASDIKRKKGNLNLSFFTTRRAYNRKINLGLIRDAINELSNRGHVEINHRDDIILDEKWKISGKTTNFTEKAKTVIILSALAYSM